MDEAEFADLMRRRTDSTLLYTNKASTTQDIKQDKKVVCLHRANIVADA